MIDFKCNGNRYDERYSGNGSQGRSVVIHVNMVEVPFLFKMRKW